MKRKLISELYWVFGATILTVAIGLWIFGSKIFDSTPVDIQLHDTYYVFPKILLFIIIFIGFLTIAHLMRGIYFKLHNKIINGILTLLLMIVFIGLVMYINMVNGYENHLSVLYSREIDIEVKADVLSQFRVPKTILWTLIIGTAIILVTTGYKTFKPKRS